MRLIVAAGLSFLLAHVSLAAEQGAPDPEALFAGRCAMCHDLGVLAPTAAQIGRLSVEEIEAVMWHGTMQEHANGLNRPQRLAIARWLAAKGEGPKERGPGIKACGPADTAASRDSGWPGWSVDNRFARHVRDASMTTARAARIELDWAHPFPVHSAFSSSGNSVAVKDGRVFTGNLNGFVYALDAARGCAHWTFRAEGRIRSNVAIEGNTLVFGDLMANVYALDARSGRLLWRQRIDWAPGARITGNVTIHRGVVYAPVSSLEEVLVMKMDLPCCTFRGAVVALAAADGAVKWKTYTIDGYAEYLGHNELGQPRFGPAGVPVWSGISVDDRRGVVYVGNGNQFTEPRVEESDAVMALDMRTGAKVWVRSLAPEQMGGQDIYHLACEAWWDPERKNCSPANPEGHGDRDIGAPPAFVTRSDGKDVIVVGTKDGMLYALDPDNQGAVLWNIRVGNGGEVGGIEYGLAADENTAYAPVVDMNADMSSNGSLTAVDLITGEALWRVENIVPECEGRPTPPCGTAFMSPPSVVGDVVFAGLIDGTLRAYDKRSGRQIVSYNTARDYDGINGLKGNGGSLGNGGPVIAGDRLYIVSGFNILNVGIPGNVLLSFKIPR